MSLCWGSFHLLFPELELSSLDQRASLRSLGNVTSSREACPVLTLLSKGHSLAALSFYTANSFLHLHLMFYCIFIHLIVGSFFRCCFFSKLFLFSFRDYKLHEDRHFICFVHSHILRV